MEAASGYPVIPGRIADANLRCAIAHRGILRFRVWSFGPSRNDGVKAFAHGRRVQRSALTAPGGTVPLMIAATCRTVSDDWLSIAGGVRPPICGVAMTFGSCASSSVGI